MIKVEFRVWDKRNGSYVTGQGLWKLRIREQIFSIEAVNENFKLEGHSGFYDSTGKVIFGGDIVSGVTNHHSVSGVVVVSQGNGTYLDSNEASFDLYDLKELKIIGNVHCGDWTDSPFSEAAASYLDD